VQRYAEAAHSTLARNRLDDVGVAKVAADIGNAVFSHGNAS
jgi:hypothetical protein